MHDVVPVDKVTEWLAHWLESSGAAGPSAPDLDAALAQARRELRALAEPRITDAMIDAAVATVWRDSWCMPEVADVLRADLTRAMDSPG